MSSEVKITLVRSHIGKPAKLKTVLLGLGLNKVNKSVVLQDTPEIRGMITKVSHLIRIDK